MAIDPMQQLFISMQRVNPQFGFGGWEGSTDPGYFGGPPRSGPGGGKLRHEGFHAIPPNLIQSRASGPLAWLIDRVPGRGSHLGIVTANQLIRAARQGTLAFDPSGMRVADTALNAAITDPNDPRYWKDFGINQENARQVAHARRAVGLLQAIQEAHAARRANGQG